MGYHTRFALSVDAIGKRVFDDLLRLLGEQEWSGQINFEPSIKEGEPFFRGGEEAKWYDHEEHMRAFSKRWPGILFTLEGEGEDNEDIWKKYFLNGKCQVAKAVITMEAFDRAKLK